MAGCHGSSLPRIESRAYAAVDFLRHATSAGRGGEDDHRTEKLESQATAVYTEQTPGAQNDIPDKSKCLVVNEATCCRRS
jgi:hypothetical protein